MRIKKCQSKIKRLSIIATFSVSALVIASFAINNIITNDSANARSPGEGSWGGTCYEDILDGNNNVIDEKEIDSWGRTTVKGEFIITEGSGETAKGEVRLYGYGTACPQVNTGIRGRRLVAECLQSADGRYFLSMSERKDCDTIQSEAGVDADTRIDWGTLTNFVTGKISTTITDTTDYPFVGTTTDGVIDSESSLYIKDIYASNLSSAGCSLSEQIGHISYTNEEENRKRLNGESWEYSCDSNLPVKLYGLGVFFCSTQTEVGSNTITGGKRECGTSAVFIDLSGGGTTEIGDGESYSWACYGHISGGGSDPYEEDIYSGGKKTSFSESDGCSGGTVEITNPIPTTQFLGGGVLTNSAISTSTMKTTRFDSSQNKYVTDRIFGTWTEYAIVSGGTVTGMASGAAFGYNGGFWGANSTNSASKSGSGNWKQGGGLVTSDLPNTANNYKCAYSKMTIFNSECDDSTKSIGNAPDVTNKRSKSNAQVAKLRAMFTNDSGTPTPIHKSTRQDFINDKACGTGTVEIGKDNLSANTYDTILGENDFYVICTSDVVVIYGDIKYDNTKTYTAETVPQMLIFANAIYILPSVRNIDSWLIANNRINTCVTLINSGSSNDSAKCAANQLVVNGPVYTGKLELTRTYTNIKSGKYTGGGSSFTVEGKDDKSCTIDSTTKADTQIKTSWNTTGKANEGETWGYTVYEKDYNWKTTETRYQQSDTGRLLRINGTYYEISGYTRYSKDTCKEADKNTSGKYININGCRKIINSDRYFAYVAEVNYGSYYDAEGSLSGQTQSNVGTDQSSSHYTIDACYVAEPAEVFNLREDAKIWAYSETKKRQSNASVTGLTEVLPFW